MDGLFYIGAAVVALIFAATLVLRALRVLFALVLVGVKALQYAAVDAAAALRARALRLAPKFKWYAGATPLANLPAA